MFIDELKIHAKAGDGGDGVVRWRHEKGREFAGPSGGDGGYGGNVFATAVRDSQILSKYRTKKEFIAERGGDGMKDSLHGAVGKDLEILVPIGSVITNMKSGEKISLLEEGEKLLLLKGGASGRGNEHYKSSTNRSPKEFTKGWPGEEADFYIEVELVADIGLIGLPNAGKSSLLNAITNANAKVGAHPFTTLEPNLGEFYGYIISDIPGLIEGASEGKGLGHKFLKHIKRTKMLVHLISLENEDVDGAYKTIRNELGQFDKELLNKKEIVVLTKTDLIEDKKQIDKIIKKIIKKCPIVIAISLYDDNEIKLLRDLFIRELAK